MSTCPSFTYHLYPPAALRHYLLLCGEALLFFFYLSYRKLRCFSLTSLNMRKKADDRLPFHSEP